MPALRTVMAELRQRGRALVLMFAALGLFGCSSAPEGASEPMTVEPKSAVPAPCHAIRVTFGSYAMGIDRPAAAAIEEILANHPAVRSVARSGHGREGEYSLLVEVFGKAQAAQLAATLRERVPVKPRGPVEVVGPFPCGAEKP